MMVIESYANNKDNNNKDNANSNNKREPIHYKQLVNYSPDEIIQLFQSRGIVIECHTCKYSYIDRKQKNYFTYDYSICPNCKAFNLLIKKNSNEKKKHSICIEREYINATDVIPFLRCLDLLNDAKVEITFIFDNKDDAIMFVTHLDGQFSSSSKSVKVFVTTH